MIVNTDLEMELHLIQTAHLKIVRGNSLSCIDGTSHEKYIHPVMFTLLPDKKETTYHGLLTLMKSWSSIW